MEESGIQTPERPTPRLIVSLTSHPPRIAESYAAVYSLLTQSLKPDKVVLWLAQSQFPCKEHDLPWELLHLRQFGLSIQWCEDLKALKKILPSLRAYPDDIVVLADDDILYPSNWLERLYAAHQKDPTSIQARVTYRVFRNEHFHYYLRRNFLFFGKEAPPSLLYVPLARMGVLYPPHVLTEEVLRTDLAMQFAPYDDELWCWMMMIVSGAKVHALCGGWEDLIELPLARPLAARLVEFCMYFGHALAEFYPEVRTILVEEERAMPQALGYAPVGPGV
jgi:hypothetical protein